MPVDPKARGGFVSLKGAFVANLADHQGIELRVRNNLSKVYATIKK